MVISRRDLIHRIGQAGGGGLIYASAASAGEVNSSSGGDPSREIPSLPSSGQFAGYPLNAHQFGAKGDGITDDTAALQKAIDAAFSQAINLYLPAGIYRTTDMLIIGGQGSNRSGWRIFGAGPGQYAGPGGTEIRYSGDAGKLAVLQVDSTAWRTCLVEEMTLTCAEALGAKYGLCFKSTEFSQHTVRRLAITNVGVAVAILTPSGGNGEFTLFDDCYFADVDGWYYTNAPQAFVPLFRHCRGAVNFGGIYFNLDLKGKGGGGIEVLDCDATGVQKGGISNTLLFRNGGSDSVGIFLGGRIENLTQLYINQGGTPDLGMPLTISGMEIGIDFDAGNRLLSRDIDAVISTGGNTDTAVVESCRFFGTSRMASFQVRWGAWSDLRFSDCIFEFWSGPPSILSSLYATRSSIAFDNCKATTTTADGNYRPYAFDRHVEIDQLTLGKRRVYSENAWVGSGRPENLLVRPQITLSHGESLRPDPPWKIAGSGTTIAASDWQGGAGRPRSASPFSKNIVIPGATSIYQDIVSLDLSSPGTYGFDGATATLVTYQALITYLGQGAGRIAIVDSITGQVYDQYGFSRGGPQRGTQLVTLSAVIGQKPTKSYPRLVIGAIGAEPLTFEFAWQFVAAKPNATFADSTDRAATYGGEWGAVVESVLAFDRVALPHKSDRFGAASAFPLNDLGSDIYLSATDEKLTYYADGRWWKISRSTPGTAAPTQGAWARGDKVENAEPAELGDAGARYVILGWICVSGGTPGQWLAMRVATGN